MPKILTLNKYSLGTKVILTLIFFIFIFIFIRFSLVIPKIKKDAYNHELENISKSLFYVKEQMKMTVKAIKMQTHSQSNYIKEKLASQIKDIKEKNLSEEQLIKTLENSTISNFCAFKIQKKDYEYKKIRGKDLFIKNNPLILDTWQSYEKKYEEGIVQRKKIYFFYNTIFSKDILLTLGCHSQLLNPDHETFEEELRAHIQKNLSLLESTINSKIIILWINSKLLYDHSRPLYEKDEIKRQKRYRISKLSNTKVLTTGELSAKEILNARDKAPLIYTLNKKEVVTWVKNLSIKGSPNLYTLIYTVNKEDILNKSSLNLFILLPETLIAIVIASILFLLILKNLLKKIEEKTKELQNLLVEKEILLDEKETLLKEIHHRVKNNLAKTISLIELQENEVKDEKTKKALVDIKERIYTMELLHRKLYESTNLNKISLKAYVVDLVNAISRTHTSNLEVKITYKIENLNFNIETAMPCGLILNELITNSFKYAFKNTTHPKLEIIISKKEQYFEMIVKDNGKGLKKEFLNNHKTLGLKLINTITRFQLHGTFEYQYENGAVFTIQAQIKE